MASIDNPHLQLESGSCDACRFGAAAGEVATPSTPPALCISQMRKYDDAAFANNPLGLMLPRASGRIRVGGSKALSTAGQAGRCHRTDPRSTSSRAAAAQWAILATPYATHK